MDSYFVVDDSSRNQPGREPSESGSRTERTSEVSVRAVRRARKRQPSSEERDFREDARSSEEGRREDALASGADEGRDKLR